MEEMVSFLFLAFSSHSEFFIFLFQPLQRYIELDFKCVKKLKQFLVSSFIYGLFFSLVISSRQVKKTLQFHSLFSIDPILFFISFKCEMWCYVSSSVRFCCIMHPGLLSQTFFCLSFYRLEGREDRKLVPWYQCYCLHHCPEREWKYSFSTPAFSAFKAGIGECIVLLSTVAGVQVSQSGL